MKIFKRTAMALVLSASLFGCRARTMPNSREGVITTGQSVSDVLAAGTGEEIPATIPPEAPVQEEKPQTEPSAVYEAVDIDLTDSSETMLYSEVIMIADELDQNLGKIIRVRGQYMDYHDDASTDSYPSVIVLDATKCCATGLVFDLSSGSYPAEGEEITVTGKLADYPSADSPFPELAEAVITKN